MFSLKYLPILFLTSCSALSPPPPTIETVCEKTYTALEMNDKNVCSSAVLCSYGIVGQFNSYFCVCDKICICFFKSAKREISCENVDDLTCNSSNFMTFLGGDFCETSEEIKFKFLETLGKVVEGYKGE